MILFVIITEMRPSLNEKNTTHLTNYQQSKHWPTPYTHTTHKGLPKPI